MKAREREEGGPVGKTNLIASHSPPPERKKGGKKEKTATFVREKRVGKPADESGKTKVGSLDTKRRRFIRALAACVSEATSGRAAKGWSAKSAALPPRAKAEAALEGKRENLAHVQLFPFVIRERRNEEKE
jgi:hypothetical protein